MTNQSANKSIKPKKGEIIEELRDELYSHRRFASGVEDEKRRLWIYDGGIYVPYGENLALRELSLNHTRTEMSLIHSTVDRIKAESLKALKVFNQDMNKVVMENGTFDMTTKTLRDWSPDDYSTIKIPVIYDPKATCPTIDKFLIDSLSPENIKVFHEIVGYCLLRRYTIRKLIIFIGANQTGKGTAMNLISRFIGDDNISNIDLITLIEDKFAAEGLHMKLANIVGDMRTLPIKETGFIKSLTGDDGIDARLMYSQNPIKFHNYAKIIMGTNTIPKVIDPEEFEKFVTRYQFVMFPNIVAKPDTSLLSKMSTPKELSGLFNHALEGLARINGKTEFSAKMSIEETIAFMGLYATKVGTFITERMEQTFANESATKAEVYEAYVKYCKEKSITADTVQKFWRDFWKQFNKTQRTQMDSYRLEGKNKTQIISGWILRSEQDIKNQETMREELLSTKEAKKTSDIISADESADESDIILTDFSVEDWETRTPFEIYQDELAEQYYRELDAEVDEVIKKEEEKLPEKEDDSEQIEEQIKKIKVVIDNEE